MYSWYMYSRLQSSFVLSILWLEFTCSLDTESLKCFCTLYTVTGEWFVQMSDHQVSLVEDTGISFLLRTLQFNPSVYGFCVA